MILFCPLTTGDAECREWVFHRLCEGSGERVRVLFLGLGAFHFPLMALSVLPTGCPTDFGDNRQSSGWVYMMSNALSPELPSVSIQTT